MARGRTKANYASDILATVFTVDVPDDQFADPNRGWSAAPPGQIRLTKGLRPRHVEGLSPTTGRRAKAVIANTGAGLWTRAATSFSNIGNDGVVDTYNITGLIGESVTL